MLAGQDLAVRGAEHLAPGVADLLRRIAQRGVLAVEACLMELVERMLPLRDDSVGLAHAYVIELEGLELCGQRERFSARYPAHASRGIHRQRVEPVLVGVAPLRGAGTAYQQQLAVDL